MLMRKKSHLIFLNLLVWLLATPAPAFWFRKAGQYDELAGKTGWRLDTLGCEGVEQDSRRLKIAFDLFFLNLSVHAIKFHANGSLVYHWEQKDCKFLSHHGTYSLYEKD